MKKKVINKKNIVKSNRKKIIISTTSILLTSLMLINYIPKYKLKQEYKRILSYNIYTNGDYLDSYDKLLNNYASQINSLELNDIELIVKVMNDIWNEVDGYGKPTETIIGLYNLSFIKEGKGVCTSFADEFTNRMNKINYKYNARNIILDNLENINVKFDRINIDRPIITSSEKESKDIQEYSKHMATAIDLPDKNITLIVDTTNLAIGILKMGKVYMFNCDKNLFSYDINSNYTYSNYSLLDILNYYFSSFFYSSENINSLDHDFGIEAQNQAYSYIETLPNTKKILKNIQ